MGKGEQFHFVLVHGGSHGAWSWYKIVDLLHKSGHKVTALDLASSGVHPSSAESISSFFEYTQPLADFFQSLDESEKVVLVGHSYGGISLMHVTELFPRKIAAAVYVAAAMFPAGMSSKDMEAQLRTMNDLFAGKAEYSFGKGMDNPPTTVTISKQYIADLFYHKSPSQDKVLASLLVRPTPLAVLTGLNFETSIEGYGSVARVYVKTAEDRSFSPEYQDLVISQCQPDKVFKVDSDHSPFFSAPEELHQILLSVGDQYCSTQKGII